MESEFIGPSSWVMSFVLGLSDILSLFLILKNRPKGVVFPNEHPGTRPFSDHPHQCSRP